ncbi:MAG: hypothetical protein ACWGOD_06015 [Desulfobulbales bacterium]
MEQDKKPLFTHTRGTLHFLRLTLITQCLPVHTTSCAMTVITLQSRLGRGHNMVQPPIHFGRGKTILAS